MFGVLSIIIRHLANLQEPKSLNHTAPAKLACCSAHYKLEPAMTVAIGQCDDYRETREKISLPWETEG